MTEDAEVFTVISQCFAPTDERAWTGLVQGSGWSEFLDASRRLLQDSCDLGRDLRPVDHAHKRCPLQDFLSAGEVDALFCPPTSAEKQAFAARHFTGGLPESALPVESLYTTWARPHTGTLFPQAEGMYKGESALYMEALIASLGLNVPEEFTGCPDHLALELDLVAVLLRSGMMHEAQVFLAERFEWLTAYRMRLLALQDDARFYIGLVDVLLGIRAQQTCDALSA